MSGERSLRVLVSGGNGFVGRELTRLLVAAGHNVLVADSLHTGAHRFRAEELAGFELVTLDLLDVERLSSVVEDFRPDALVHLAAMHFIPECEADPGRAVQINVAGTVNLLDLCQASTRFVLASSAAVYQPSEAPHDELRSPLGPDDVYGLSKVQAERWVEYFAPRRGFSALIARLSNIVGPGETNPHVLPEIVAQLKAGHRTVELGNLASRRDYLDVADAARGLGALATASEPSDGTAEVINLGSGRSHSVAELLALLRDIPGVPAFEVEVTTERSRRVDRPMLHLAITRARERFGWVPHYDLAETLERTWELPELPPSLTDRYPTTRSEEAQ